VTCQSRGVWTSLSLRQLLADARFVHTDDMMVSSCCLEARRVQPGDLFVATQPAVGKRRAQLQLAAARGAKGAVVERAETGSTLPQCVVPDAREAYARICHALVGDPAAQLKAIGVTGSCGKTSTAILTASVLSHGGLKCGLLSSIGYTDTELIVPAPRTTPYPGDLARWLERMVATGCSHGVIEVSNSALAEQRVAGFEFDAVGITNVLRDGRQRFSSLAHYRHNKSKILNGLAPEGVAILNADDSVSSEWLSRIDGPALTVGLDVEAELTATVVTRSGSEQIFLLEAGRDTFPVRTRIIGDQHISNCLIAAALGLVQGVGLPDIVRGLEAVERFPGRMERIDCGQPFAVIVDVADTPDALAACLRTVRKVTSGRIRCVWNAGSHPTDGCCAALAATMVRMADTRVVTVSDEQCGACTASARRLATALGGTALAIPNRAEAMARTLELAKPGDTVVVAGRPHPPRVEDTQRDNTTSFDDREFVRHYLYEIGEPISFSG